ncbi:MAG: hypothetical protein JNM02_09650 [Anaerolineales bacterium]|nr:hypothetical protein [Anaerolineales bacterium]
MEKMNTWYSIILGDGMWAPTLSVQIEKEFLAVFEAASKPADMAVFTRNESEGRLHCEVIAYFSPAARAIAEAFDAEPCEKPSRTGLSLLTGDPNCWMFLFQDGNL